MQEQEKNNLSPCPISSTNDLAAVSDPKVGRPNPSETKQVKLEK